MKKQITHLLLLFIALIPNLSIISQEDPVVENEKVQKFRFGLNGMSSIDWLVPQNQKKFLSGSVGMGYGWGPQLEFVLLLKLCVDVEVVC